MKFKLLIALLLCSISAFSQDKKGFKFSNGMTAYFVKGEAGWGVEDQDGNTIVPKLYNKLYRYGNLVYCIEKNGQGTKCELYNHLGECKVREDDGYHVLDFMMSKGRLIATSNHPGAVFDENGDYIYKYKCLKDAAGFSYLVNELADTIVVEPGIYMGDYNFIISGDAIKTQIGSKAGVVNFDGSMVIPAQTYSYILPHNEGFHVRKSSDNGYVGYYDRTGCCIIPDDKYTQIYRFSNGTFLAIRDGKSLVLDSLGNQILETKYQNLALRKDKQGNLYYETYLGNGRGKITLNGELIEEAKPTVTKKEVSNKEIEYIEVTNENGLVGAVDTLGKTIIPCEYDRIYYSTGSTIKGFELKKNGKVGFADRNGNIIIPCGKYDDISSIGGNGEYFFVEESGRKGLCSPNGEELIKPLFDDIRIYKGVIYPTVGIMEGVVDRNGEVIVPFEYTKVSKDHKTGDYRVELFGKKGICNSCGEIIVPPIYTSAYCTEFDAGPFGSIYSVKDGKKNGIFRRDGKMIFPASLFEHVRICNQSDNITDLPITNEWYIKAYNNYDDGCYYYDLDGNFLYDDRRDRLRVNYFRQGYDEFKKKNYTKSIEFYQKGNKIKEDGTAYYNIGLAYYNIGKYNDAINNFQKCIQMSDAQSVHDDAKDMILECRLCVQKKRERRAHIWKNALGTVLDIGTALLQYNSATMYNSSLYSSGASFGSGLDYLLDPRYATMQVQQREWNEYLQMTNGGTTMTYNEWGALKGQAIQNLKDQGYDVLEENRKIHEQQRKDFDKQREEDKKTNFERYGFDTSSLSQAASEKKDVKDKSASKPKENKQPQISNNSSKDDDKIDSKQQYKSDGVSSEDYHYEKKVTLYMREANSNKRRFPDQKDLCKKGAYYYIKIDNTYYPVSVQGGWGFNSSIQYGTRILYFDM